MKTKNIRLGFKDLFNGRVIYITEPGMPVMEAKVRGFLNTSTKAITIATIAFAANATAGGTLGGNPGADSGAVNVSVGKCTIYKQQVKEAAKQSIDTSTIEKPEGC